MNISEKIKSLRKSNNMTLQDLAYKSGMSKTYIWKLESGSSKNIGLGKLEGLAKALGVEVGWLAGEEVLHDEQKAKIIYSKFSALDLKDQNLVTRIIDRFLR